MQLNFVSDDNCAQYTRARNKVKIDVSHYSAKGNCYNDEMQLWETNPDPAKLPGKGDMHGW